MLFLIEQKQIGIKISQMINHFGSVLKKKNHFSAKIRQGLESLIDYKGSRASNIDLEGIR